MADPDAKYRPLINVATGIKAQLDACLEALDKFDNLPEEGEDLGKTLAEAHGYCEAILRKADKEPLPEE